MKPRPSNEAGPHRPGPSGEPIRPDELYPWAALHERLGWGSAAVAEARRRGLRPLVFARHHYFTGRALIDFLERHGQPQDSSSRGQG